MFAAVMDRRYNRKMIIRARSVVTMDGAPIEDGAVRVTGTRIGEVGKFPEVCLDNDEEILDLGECILLPGLINAHCHLDYTCLRGKIPADIIHQLDPAGNQRREGRRRQPRLCRSINGWISGSVSIWNDNDREFNRFPS
jgi:predicted amidohydrolase YtcJ